MSFNFVYKVIKSKCRTQDNTKIENMTRCNILRESKVEIYRLWEIPREYLYRRFTTIQGTPLDRDFFSHGAGARKAKHGRWILNPWLHFGGTQWYTWEVSGDISSIHLLSSARCCGSDCDLLSPHNAHCMLQLLHMIHHKLNTFHSYILLISIPKQSTLQHTMHPGFCTNQNEFSLLLTVFSICILDRVAPLTVKRGLIAEESVHPVLWISLRQPGAVVRNTLAKNTGMTIHFLKIL